MRLSEFGYISNILSLSRIVLVIPIYYFLTEQTTTGSYIAAILMIIAALTDAFDGALARKLKQQTDLGRVLDPIADKIAIGLIAIVLWQTRGLPLWFMILVVGRDVLIMVLAMFVISRKNVVVESNMLGKVTVNVLALTVLTFTLEFEPVNWVLLWLSVGFIVASAIGYYRKMMRVARQDEANP